MVEHLLRAAPPARAEHGTACPRPASLLSLTPITPLPVGKILSRKLYGIQKNFKKAIYIPASPDALKNRKTVVWIAIVMSGQLGAPPVILCPQGAPFPFLGST